VALLPVVCVNADAGNSERMTDAMADSLARHGCRMVPEATVRQALADEGVDLGRPQFVPGLLRVGQRSGANLVIYARVLVQGPSVRQREVERSHCAMVLHVMVVDSRSGDLLLSNQISQEWESIHPTDGHQTASEAAASAAAERLLTLLYEPVRVTGRVVDAETGNPVAGAEAFMRQEGAQTRVVVTDESGRYGFDALARRRYAIGVRAPGYYLVSQPLPFGLGERQVTLVVTPRPASVTGFLR